MRRHGKKVIALLCVIVLGIGLLPNGGLLTKADAGYKEYTFADFEIKDQSITGTDVYSEKVPYSTSLDKVAINGNITFPEGSAVGSENIQIGNMCLIGPANDTTLGVWNITNGGWYGFSNSMEDGIIGKQLAIRLAFTKEGNDYRMLMEVNGTEAGEVILSNGVSALTWHALMFHAGAGKTVVIGDVRSQEPDFTEYTLKDFGIKDGFYKTGLTEGQTPKGVTSLDGIAVVGHVAFSNGSSCLRIGGTEEDIYASPITIFNSNGTLWSWDELGTNEHVSIGQVEIDKAVKIKVAFEYIGKNVKVRFYLNDELAAEHIYVGYAEKLGTKVILWARSGALAVGQGAEILPEAPIDQKTPQALGYTQIRLEDFELTGDTYSPQHKYGNFHYGTAKKKSLDRTYLDVNLTFKKAETLLRENSLRYASRDGWTGIQIGIEQNQLVIQDAMTGIGIVYQLEDLGLRTFEKRFNLKLGVMIGKANQDGKQDVTYDLWINDIRVAAKEVLKGVGSLGNGLGIYTPSGTVALQSPESVYGNQETGKKEKLPTTFRSLTFASFGVKDGTYRYKPGKMAAYGEYALSLDKTIFSTDLYFSLAKGGDFRYGGKSNEWCGLWFYSMPDGKIYMQGVEGHTGTYVFKPFVAGTELTDKKFNLKLTTEIVDSDKDGKKDDVKLGVWFNGVLYDNAYIYLTDYASYLGCYAGVYVDKGTGYLKVWNDKSVDLAIDYTLFGYTKENWRKKIGL